MWPLAVHSPYSRNRHRSREQWRIAAWVFLFFLLIPAATFSAYMPNFLIPGNNLSDVSSASTSRTNLGLGTIATQNASAVAITGGALDGTTVGATTASTVKATSVTDTGIASGNQCVQANSSGLFGGTGSACPPGLTVTTVTGATPFTLSSTSGTTTVSSMATPTAATYNLPTPTASFRGCLKDGTTNFASNTATVKSPSGNIDGTTGSTGITMTQKGQELCFISDGTNYFIE